VAVYILLLLLLLLLLLALPVTQLLVTREFAVVVTALLVFALGCCTWGGLHSSPAND